jgi:hypothetical protein
MYQVNTGVAELELQATSNVAITANAAPAPHFLRRRPRALSTRDEGFAM